MIAMLSSDFKKKPLSGKTKPYLFANNILSNQKTYDQAKNFIINLFHWL